MNKTDSLRALAYLKGHAVVGALRRVKDDVFYKNGVEVHLQQYVDAEGTLYAVNRLGALAYIAGEDWVI